MLHLALSSPQAVGVEKLCESLQLHWPNLTNLTSLEKRFLSRKEPQPILAHHQHTVMSRVWFQVICSH